MIALLLILAPAFAEASAGGQEITLAEYRDRLRAVDEAVARQDLDAARTGARELQPARIRHEGMAFSADGTVLDPIVKSKDLPSAREAVRPLRSLLGELESIGGGAPPAPPDAGLFERLRKEEEIRSRSPDSNVGGPVINVPEVPQSILDRLLSLLEAIGDRCRRFLYWLLYLIFGSTVGAAAQTPSTRFLVVGLVITVLGILGIVAVLVLRRRRRAVSAVAVSEAPARSEKDEDPLSRTASEWERFAADLMRAGRFREAIRAWYHAVLVSLFRAGALHYRKDKTNWEYAYALPSGVPWRAGFMDATRTFEREWYGRRDTPPETAEIYQAQALRMLADVRQGAPR